MAPALLFALALLAADPAPADPLADVPWPAGAPTDDYGLVAWCYGALSAHMKLHDKVMPEVERIEGQWSKGPDDLSASLKSYDEQRVEGVRAVAQFRRAMEAAEKASIKPLQETGAESIKKGAGTWAAAARVDKRRLAQEWMSWGLPGRCVPTAQALEKKSALFGQALNYNAKDALPPATETPAPEETVDATVDDILADLAAQSPEAAPAAEPAAETAPEASEETPAVAEPTPEEDTPTLRGAQ